MKLVVKILVLVLLGLAALGFAGVLLVPPAAKTAVDSGSRHAFGVPSTLGDVTASLGLSQTTVGFTDYVLSSPEGFDEPLLSIGRFQVGVGTTSIVGDVKEVGALVLEDVTLSLTQDGTRNNLVPVLQHVRGLGGGDEGGTEPDASDGSEGDASPGPRLRIGTVRVAGIAARLRLAGVPGIEPFDERYEIPAYEEDWSDVTGEDGLTVSEIAGRILDGAQARALDAAEGVAPEPVLAALRSTLAGGLEGGLEGALDSAKDAAEGALRDEADEQIDDLKGRANDEAKKALDGLLGGDGR